MIYPIKNDTFRKLRGGKAVVVEILCSACDTWLMTYQKDGVGKLHRCYLNRIIAPRNLEQLQRNLSISEPRQLLPVICQKCNKLIGVPKRHADGRLAFHLMPGSFKKQRSK